jgi:hypothetical protein
MKTHCPGHIDPQLEIGYLKIFSVRFVSESIFFIKYLVVLLIILSKM